MEMNKTYSVIVSKRATQRLVSHAAFLAKVSLEAANRLVALFEETANSLAAGEMLMADCGLHSTQQVQKNSV